MKKTPGNRSFKYIALGIIYFYIKEAVCHNSEDSPFIKRGICHICLRIHFQSYFILLLNLVQTFHVKFCTALCTTFYVKKNELSSVTLFFFHLIYITLGEKAQDLRYLHLSLIIDITQKSKPSHRIFNVLIFINNRNALQIHNTYVYYTFITIIDIFSSN